MTLEPASNKTFGGDLASESTDQAINIPVKKAIERLILDSSIPDVIRALGHVLQNCEGIGINGYCIGVAIEAMADIE